MSQSTHLATSLRILTGALVLILCMGCRRRDDVECRAFVQAVNFHLAEIDRVTDQETDAQAPNPVNMRHLAGLYQDLAEKTQTLTIHSSELCTLRDKYQLMVLDAAKLASSIADALEAKDIPSAMKTHERFSEVVSREDALVGRVNALCRGTR